MSSKGSFRFEAIHRIFRQFLRDFMIHFKMNLLKEPMRKTHYKINTPLCSGSDKFEIVYSERMQEHICFHTF